MVHPSSAEHLQRSCRDPEALVQLFDQCRRLRSKYSSSMDVATGSLRERKVSIRKQVVPGGGGIRMAPSDAAVQIPAPVYSTRSLMDSDDGEGVTFLTCQLFEQLGSAVSSRRFYSILSAWKFENMRYRYHLNIMGFVTTFTYKS